MKKQFYCETCENVFKAAGEKQEWLSKLYGPSWKYTAVCPTCKEEANEYKPVSMSRRSGAAGLGAPSCPTGTCPFAAN